MARRDPPYNFLVGRVPRSTGARRSGPGITGLDEPEDVVLGNAAADPRSGYLGDVDVVLAGDATDERRRLLSTEIVQRCFGGATAI